MSSFVVSAKTLGHIIWCLREDAHTLTRDWTDTLLKRAGFEVATIEGAKRFARELHRMNVRAVRYRYADDKHRYTFVYEPVKCSIYQAVKSMHCLHYQCSEGDVPEEPLFKLLEDLTHAIESAIVTHSAEYELADWD